MPHAIWSGSINFGLVAIPVKLLTAVRSSEGIHFHLLHNKDRGRIRNERVCSECGEKLAWDDVTRGYEYEKGRYVEVTDEEIKAASVEATQSVQIVQFVEEREIDPIYFDVAYYLEPEKKGRHAYALLREALGKAAKVGVARVVIRTREHIAVLKPKGDALVLELLHWADEIVDASSIDLPGKEALPAPEMKMAATLIDTMTEKWDPAAFRDTYREQLVALIEAKARGEPMPKGRAKAPARAQVVDLMDVLKRSIESTKRAPKPGPVKAHRRAKGKHRAA
jgi:DNA end-binding protein Ku